MTPSHNSNYAGTPRPAAACSQATSGICALGNTAQPKSFSIAGWPPMFVPRTSNPADPCFVGSNEKARGPRPEAFSGNAAQIDPKTRAWAVWSLLVKRGEPLTTNEISMRTGILRTSIGHAVCHLIKADAVRVMKLPGHGHQCAYSLGPTPVEAS